MRRILKKSDSVIADILDDSAPRPKVEKKKYVRPSVQIGDEDWSDGERDYGKPIWQAKDEKKGSLEEVKENYVIKSKIGVSTRAAPKAVKIFHGDIKVEKKVDEKKRFTEEKKVEEEIDFDIPLPYVPSHIVDILGEKTIKLLWKEFLFHGSDETELLEIEHLPTIAEKMTRILGFQLPFDQINFPMAENEYTDFSYVINFLAKLLNAPGVVKIQEPDRIYLPPCCVNQACQLHRRTNEKYQSGNEIRSNFRLDVIFRRMIVEKQGVVRVNHIPEMLREAEIPFNLNNLPSNYLILHGDKLITSYDVLFETVELLRGDNDTNTDTLDRLYALPKWLQNEFTTNEILLFRHHFMMIDIDCGGTIDKHELQLLGESLGNTISEEEAMKIIAEHDTDGEGSLDFEEFMTLMFQILRGTIDIQNDILAKTMMESRNQIRIFEEIESIKSYQPTATATGGGGGGEGEGSIDSYSQSQSQSHGTSVSSTFSLSLVRVLHYGQIPVVCEYLLKGPIHSSYANGKFVIKVIYHNGYPFQCPTVTIATRLLHLNFLPLIGGSYAIPHLEAIWDSSWTTKELLEHIYELLQCPNPRLLPEDMIEVYNRYVSEFYEITDPAMLITSVFQQRARGNREDRGGREQREEEESPPASPRQKEEKEEGQGEGASEEKAVESLGGGSLRGYAEVLKRMPRMRQYHMNLIVKYFLDNESYEELVRQAVKLYARKKEYDTEEEEEEEEEDGVEEEEEAEREEEEAKEIEEEGDDREGDRESLGEEKYSEEDFEEDNEDDEEEEEE